MAAAEIIRCGHIQNFEIGGAMSFKGSLGGENYGYGHWCGFEGLVFLLRKKTLFIECRYPFVEFLGLDCAGFLVKPQDLEVCSSGAVDIAEILWIMELE